MRRAYRYGEERDRTPGQRALRQLLNDSPKEFLAQLAGLEKAILASTPVERPKKEKEPEEPSDAGTDRCLKLAESLLDEFGIAASQPGETK